MHKSTESHIHCDEEKVHPLPPFLMQQIGEGRASEPEVLQRFRKKSQNALFEHGMPHQGLEGFEYTRFFDTLSSSHFLPITAFEGGRDVVKKFLYTSCENSTLVFMNGYFRQDLSSIAALKDLVILPLTQAGKKYQALFHASLSRLAQEEKDACALMNDAYHQDGFFLFLPPGKKVEQPIHILSVVGDIDEPSWAMPRVQIVLGKHAEASFVESFHCHTQSLLYNNQHILFDLDEGARLHHTHICFDGEGTSVIHTDSVRAFLQKDATFTSTSYTIPSLAARRSYSVWLRGEGASCDVTGSWMLSGKQEGHTHALVHHEEPHTTSLQLFKGVVQDASRSSFEGKIFVAQKAQKTQAYQLNNNLVLGNNAHSFSKPNLEIFADDVKASHGATTGQLDEEALFYLRTRGLSRKAAERCLIEGFLSEVAARIQVQEVFNAVIERIHAYSG